MEGTVSYLLLPLYCLSCKKENDMFLISTEGIDKNPTLSPCDRVRVQTNQIVLLSQDWMKHQCVSAVQ